MVLAAFKKHEKSSLDAKALAQKEREDKQRKIDEKRQKEKQEQEKATFSASSAESRVQELTDEEADKLQKEIDAEKARESAGTISEKSQEVKPAGEGEGDSVSSPS